MSLLIGETAGALAGLAAVGALTVGVIQEVQSARRMEQRAAALETAQNLAQRVRLGGPVDLPPGWSVSRTVVEPGITVVRLHGPGVHLATVVAAGEAP